MKKIAYRLFAGVGTLIALAGCSNNNTTDRDSVETLFTVNIEAKSRATNIAPTRYVMEVWSEDGTLAENVFDNGTNHAEATSGSFTATLDLEKAYTCLFWADDNGVTYDAASLKAIAPKSGSVLTESYFAKMDVAEGKNPAVSVVLTRAVAKVILEETADLEAGGKLIATYCEPAQFNVLTGSAEGTEVERTYSKVVSADQLTGKFAEFFLLGTKDKTLVDFTFAFDNEPAKKVTNVPVQMNYRTNIKGEFSNMYDTVFIMSNELDEYENNPEIPLDLPPFKTIVIDGVEFEFVLVKKGTFMMGTPGITDTQDVERPCWVRLTQDYYIGKTEITQEQYLKIMGNNPSYFDGTVDPSARPSKETPPGEIQEKRPAENMSWLTIYSGTVGDVTVALEDCFLYKMTVAAKLEPEWEFHLPTEAQWEYAARGGHRRDPEFMAWPGTNDLDEVSDYVRHVTPDNKSFTHQVATRKPNLLGLYDMGGNVEEWCRNTFHYYPTNTTRENPEVDLDPVSGSIYRVLRGGSSRRFEEYCRSAYRNASQPEAPSYVDSGGFRLVLMPPIR